MSKKSLTISKKIKEDWGTVLFFCKKHNLNIHTFMIMIDRRKNFRLSD